ncbi:histone deacetylase [Leptolyngbya cf. ectocarpi LEGE 11479]|uniref:Histone deacetylase n=1 Tax=Leptolyngbya cf. ectocarpi LEGE 11479 TaxID=1828722 RepID=A0A928X2W2_LEPEC|nr:histone deacetylase [Leptolyngbya ectocarpi]MBE9066346.1 histone deacetylase [Leptolyngbya cf. ectocarpi LEGE 11479]
MSSPSSLSIPPFRVIYSQRFLDHDTGMGHPENAGRLRAVVAALKAHPIAERLEWVEPCDRNPLPQINAVHDPAYVLALQRIAQRGGGRLDGDTPVSAASYDIALLAVAAWLDGVDHVLATNTPGFVLARPPGHHAEYDQGMGFCLLSNAAIAARYALEQPGIDRVAVLDWDVHHGNGTQQLVSQHPQVAYCSLHQMPAYPGTGQASETGSHGNLCNIPMVPGSVLRDYQTRFDQQVLPFLQQFQPDLLLVSAGYDATAADPLASVNLSPADYGVFTAACKKIAPRVLFGLEGGYDYQALSQSVIATIEAAIN